jgi:hypothetical protein
MTENIPSNNSSNFKINPINNQLPSIPPFNPTPHYFKKIFFIIILIIFFIAFSVLAFLNKNFQKLENKKTTNTQNLIPSSPSPKLKYEKIVVKKKPPAELYMDIKNQLIKIFKEK